MAVDLYLELHVEHKCDKCGKHQQPDKSESNESWDVFKTGVRCSCGGLFVVYLDNKPVGGKSDD